MSKRKCFSIKEKNLILHEMDKGVKKSDMALKFGIPPNSLSTIIKNRDKIQNYDSSNSCSKRLKTCVYEDVDEAVLKPDSAVDKESVHASDDETSFMAQPFPLSPVYSPDSPSKKDGSDLESESPRQENSPIDANTLSPVVYIQNSHTKKRSWLPTF
ncbi:hypothetical protein AVEN_166489-1 [Araneus ventricosus]|uniref:Uncharacterized protein n=1 Tax=Araneus ventricosus TaxID=182803 RepID=A0A4Y2SU73_ARAVE|nr:hypothetical protein AVEN_166489-1 [Araneus ventricosus]